MIHLSWRGPRASDILRCSGRDWRRLRDIFLEHENHKYPDKPLTYHPEATADEARPEIYKNRLANGRDGHRILHGTKMDGPKWVCDPHRIKILAQKRKAKDPGHPGCVIYSVGSNGDFTFELGMQKEVGEGTCEYHIFDPGNFEHRKPSKLKRAYYHQWGLEEQKESQSCLGLDLKKRSGGQSREKSNYWATKIWMLSTFLKLTARDVSWYHDWLSDSVPLLQQLLVEVHKAPKDKALDFFNSLERAGYLRYHKEPNIQWGPGCLEYAFVRVDKSFVEGKMEMLAR